MSFAIDLIPSHVFVVLFVSLMDKAANLETYQEILQPN